MKKILKILAILLGAVVALIIILAIALPFLIDPNQYKGEIVKIVKQHTGRDLKIAGKIDLSVFPWLGVEMGGLQLSNARGFGKKPFAKVDSAGVKVELLPLFRKEIRVDTVFMDGLELNLARSAQGRNNWDDLTKTGQEQRPAGPGEKRADVGLAGFLIGKIDIRAANIAYQDKQTGAAYAVHNLELKTGKISRGRPVDLRLAFDLEAGSPPLRTRVALKSKINVDLDRQTFDIPTLSLTLDDLALKAAVKGSRIFDAPSLKGGFEITAFSPRALMKKLGIEYAAADKNTLTRLSLKSDFSASGNSAQLKGLNIQLDDSRINGTVEIQNFARPAYKLDLTIDQLDLDRYLPPETPEQKSAASANPVVIGVAVLRRFNTQGRLQIKRLKAMGIRATDVVIRVAANDGLITLGPNKAKLYGGSYAGHIVMDARGKTPVFKINERLNAIQLGPFLKDIDLFDKYSGTGNLNIKLSAKGLNDKQIKKNLDGTVSVLLRNGKIEGVNLQKIIYDAVKTYDKVRGKPVRVTTKPSDETVFTRLSATLRVTNGVARNDDLTLQGPTVRAGGQGTANLVSERLDYRMKVTLAEEASRKGTTVPVRITGTFANPKYSVDLGEIIKQKAEKKIEKKKDELKDKLKEKLKKKFKISR